MGKHLRKRQNTWIDFGFSLVIIALIITGAFILLYSGKNEASSNSDKSNSMESPATLIDKIDSNYPGIKIITETSNDSFAPLAIQYPESAYTEFNEAVSTYITKSKNEYIQTMLDYKKNDGKIHGELNISFKTYLHNSGNYSFVIATNSSSSGTSSLSEIRTFHLNPETGQTIQIDDVLQNNEDNLKAIATLVKNEVLTDEKIKDYIMLDELDISMLPKWNNFSSFALTEDELIFYFDKFQFSTIEAGTPTVKLKLEEIEEFIANPFKPIQKIVTPPPTNEEKPENKESDTPNVDETVESEKAPESSSEEVATPPSSEKLVALTFDDGPHPTVTRQILATLKKHDAVATFFMLGSRVDYYPDIAKEVQEAGHELGNHSWNHPDLTKMSDERVFNEIKNTSNVIEQATGQPATVFRPPYGAQNDTVRNQTELPIILWDVDTLDWKHRNAENTLSIIKNNTRSGSIILMHDIHQSTADALDRILSHLTSEGYTFVSVSEIE